MNAKTTAVLLVFVSLFSSLIFLPSILNGARSDPLTLTPRQTIDPIRSQDILLPNQTEPLYPEHNLSHPPASTIQPNTPQVPVAIAASGINGRVTANAAPVAGIYLILRFFDGASWSTWGSPLATNIDGEYDFVGAPSLAAGQYYYVRYTNGQNGNASNSNYLSGWYSFSLSSYTYEEATPGGDFDIANILQASPSGSVPLAVDFNWNRRPATPSDSYSLYLFDPSDDDPNFESPQVGYNSTYTLETLPPGFTYNTSYGWANWIYAPDGGSGISYYYSPVSFVQATPTHTQTPTASRTPTPSQTRTSTRTATASPTGTNTSTLIPSQTATTPDNSLWLPILFRFVATIPPEITPTFTLTHTPTRTETPTPTPTRTKTPSPTLTPTVTKTEPPPSYDWTLQSSGSLENLNSVHFINDQAGWVVGENGTILHTSNGGLNWQPQLSNTTEELRDIYFLDENNGWAVGGEGLILKTTNGGANWSPVEVSSVSSYELNAIHFYDANYGWIVGGKVYVVSFDPVYMYYLGAILITENGGQTWTKTAQAPHYFLYDVNFVDQLHGWTGGVVMSANYLYDIPRLMESEDGGVTFSNLAIPVLAGKLYGIDFIDVDTGWVVGYDQENQVGMVLFTENGGETWQEQSSGSGSPIYSVDFLDSSKGWAVCSNAILSTLDGGELWTPQSADAAPSLLRKVFFPDEMHGWVVGGTGRIYQYSSK